jgi:hypothetical protein
MRALELGPAAPNTARSQAEDLRKRISDRLEAAITVLRRHAQGIVDSDLTLQPCDQEFEWADKLFVAAAENRVYGAVLAWCNHDPDRSPEDCVEFLAEVRSEAEREVRAAARWPHRSTSPSSNLMKQEIGAAWAKVLELLP